MSNVWTRWFSKRPLLYYEALPKFICEHPWWSPSELLSLRRPLIVGLFASPDRLAQIRESRLGGLNAVDAAMSYSDLDEIKREVLAAKRLYAKHRWPTIDVTRRSVEETAAAILTKLSARENADFNPD